MYTHALADVIGQYLPKQQQHAKRRPCELLLVRALAPKGELHRTWWADKNIIIPIQRPAAAPKRNGRCAWATDAATYKNAAGSKVRSNFNRATYRLAAVGWAEAALAHSLTAHVHQRRGRAPVAEWLAISIFDCIYKRARRARSPTRWGGLAAAARATCAHLSPSPLPTTRNRMVLQNKTANEGRAANVRAAAGRGRVGGPYRRGDTWLTRRKPSPLERPEDLRSPAADSTFFPGSA